MNRMHNKNAQQKYLNKHLSQLQTSKHNIQQQG